ncbi:polysaccharide deacetylase family protein [Litorilituus sediminis]|nr:polysaccharide deacetylase family protein [Litorilituus sediminis]
MDLITGKLSRVFNVTSVCLCLGAVFIQPLSAEPIAKSVNVIEQLGYKAQDKLLILHADDVGLNASTNSAVKAAFENGYINSASIMVPAPKFVDYASYAKQNPQFDLGIHLTFTSEWPQMRWGGVLSKKEIPSLLNEQGYFYANTADFVKHAKLDEVEKEITAQIERALEAGIKPSHIDTHMAALFQNADLFALYLKLARAYQLPAVISLNFIAGNAQYMALLNEQDYGLDSYLFVTGNTAAKDWHQAYDKLVVNTKPAQVSQVTFHLGYDDEDMISTTGRDNDYGAKWRQRDMDYVSDPKLSKMLAEQGIKLISWREIQQLKFPNNFSNK